MSDKSGSLKYYIVKRILQFIPLIFGIIIFNFILVRIAPGDPAVLLAGGMASPEWIEQTREFFGLNKPLYEQLIIYLSNVLQGNLGYSFFYNQPVIDLIVSRIPLTLLLMISQLIFASIVGIVLGAMAAKKPYSFLDNITSFIAMVGWSLPSFWLGMMLILFFSLQLGWLPAQGIITLREEFTGLAYIVDLLRHLILPAFTLSLWTLAMIFRQTRASVMEQLWQDYVVTARAKGLSENKILFKHALKNASLPIITVIGLFTGYMLGGAVLVEVVFGWPGLGRLTFEAIFTRDYPIILGMTIIIAIMVIVVNLITDIVYAVIDPRVRYR